MTDFLVDIPGVGEITGVPEPITVRATLWRAEPWLNIYVGGPAAVRAWADALGHDGPLTVRHKTSEFGTRWRDVQASIEVRGVRVHLVCTQFAVIGEELPAWPQDLAMAEPVEAVAE